MELFFTIVVTHFIALVTPGVDFFLILKTLLQSQKKAVQAVCIGIATGNAVILLMIYASLSLLGQINIEIIGYLKYVSALYLLYLSYQCIHAAFTAQDTSLSVDQSIVVMGKVSRQKAVLLGLGSSLLNPKNMMFYITLVVFIYPQYRFSQNLLLCIWMVFVVLLWNLFIVYLLSLNRYMHYLRKYFRNLYYFSGICFAIFALLLIFI